MREQTLERVGNHNTSAMELFFSDSDARRVVVVP